MCTRVAVWVHVPMLMEGLGWFNGERSRPLSGAVAAAVSSACSPGLVVAARSPRRSRVGVVTTIGDVLGAGCGRLPQGEQAGSLTAMAHQTAATVIATSQQLSDIATALRSNRTDLRLNGHRLITAFVPDNDAFEKLHRTIGDDAFASLGHNYSQGSFFAHHIVNRCLTRENLSTAGMVQAVDGDRLTIADTGSTITVSDSGRTPARVVRGNIPTSNASVFIIDTVLVGLSEN